MPFSASNTGSWIIARYALPPYNIYINFGDFFRLFTSRVFSSFSHFCEYCERVGAEQKAEHSQIPRISCWIHQLFCWDNAKHLFRRRFKNTTHGCTCVSVFSFPSTPKKQQLPCNSLNLLVASKFSTFRFPFKVASKKKSTATTNKDTQKQPTTRMNCTQQTTKKQPHQEHHVLFGFEESDPQVAGVVSPGCQVIPSFTVSKAELGIPRSFDLTTFSDRKRWFTIFFQQKQVSDAGTYDYINLKPRKIGLSVIFVFGWFFFLRREFHCWTFGDRTWGPFNGSMLPGRLNGSILCSRGPAILFWKTWAHENSENL